MFFFLLFLIVRSTPVDENAKARARRTIIVVKIDREVSHLPAKRRYYFLRNGIANLGFPYLQKDRCEVCSSGAIISCDHPPKLGRQTLDPLLVAT